MILECGARELTSAVSDSNCWDELLVMGFANFLAAFFFIFVCEDAMVLVRCCFCFC
jgi:hypothetical protein